MACLPVTIYFDFICPWSYIGKHIFDQSQKHFSQGFCQETTQNITGNINTSKWQAFPLIPQTAFLKSHDELKYHDEIAKQSRKLAKSIGLSLNFSRINKIANPIAAFSMITYLQREGLMNFDQISIVIEKIFHAYFVDGQDIGNPEFLLDTLKLPRSMNIELEKVMHSALYKNAIETTQLEAKRKGILTTPTFVFADQYQISSVMEVGCFEAIADIIRQEKQALATIA